MAADLPHEIEVDSPRVFNYDSLGAGLAAGDLDNDGDIDLVLANLDGPTALLWNETAPGGALRFRRTDLTSAEDSKPTSAIVAVDTDGDGWLDLAVTHTNRPPALWRNTPAEDGSGGAAGSGRRFVRDPDFGAGYFAHVMDWSDLDGDGDLDIVTATYDYLLAKEFDGFIPGGGVAYYENRNPGLLPALLVSGADALAVLVTDLDGDGRARNRDRQRLRPPRLRVHPRRRGADGLGAGGAARRHPHQHDELRRRRRGQRRPLRAVRRRHEAVPRRRRHARRVGRPGHRQPTGRGAGQRQRAAGGGRRGRLTGTGRRRPGWMPPAGAGRPSSATWTATASWTCTWSTA